MSTTAAALHVLYRAPARARACLVLLPHPNADACPSSPHGAATCLTPVPAHALPAACCPGCRGSAPTIVEKQGLVVVATGNTYSVPADVEQVGARVHLVRVRAAGHRLGEIAVTAITA